MRTSPEAPARRSVFVAERRAAIPPGPRLVDLPTADWILDHVLVHEQDFPRVPCACLMGICGRCTRGDCRRCSNRTRPAAWHGTSETWLLRRNGTAIEQAPVWLTDRTCRYRCWCTCRCGWASLTYRTIVGAHLEFGRHLLDPGAVRP